MKNQERGDAPIEESEAWRICSGQGTTAFIFALASMIFSGEFTGLVQEGNWRSACFWVFITWFGFLLFRSLTIAILEHFLINFSVWKTHANKLGKWKHLIVLLFIMIEFVFVYYILHFIVFPE